MSRSEHQGQGLIWASSPELLASTRVNIARVGVGMAQESAGWLERKQLSRRLEFTGTLANKGGFLGRRRQGRGKSS